MLRDEAEDDDDMTFQCNEATQTGTHALVLFKKLFSLLRRYASITLKHSFNNYVKDGKQLYPFSAVIRLVGADYKFY